MHNLTFIVSFQMHLAGPECPKIDSDWRFAPDDTDGKLTVIF